LEKIKKMIRFFQIAFFLLTYFPAYTQIAVKQPGLPYKNIYAVIVGISDYKPDDNIPPLKYAHRDAEEFNDFLRSKAGGSVPEDHIKLLINKDATVAAVYNALDWLTQTTTKDDLVYFYFAGHGDKESQTIFNLGFLLTYNTQSPIYNNNALRIEDLNNIANTLSVRNNAKVVLITDACHSGDLSTGAFHFSGLIGESLSKVQRNEVRILSCQTDQLSAENKNWGGGRGVFSYYLVNGLKGNADKDGDGMISVRDIRNYIDSGMKRDPVLIENSLKQDPVFSGSDTFKLAKVDKETADQMQLSVGLPAPIVSDMVELPKHPSERFFDELGTESLENIYDFAAMDKLPAKDLGIAMIDSLLGWELSILSRGSFWDSMALLKTYLNEDDGNLKRFNDKLVETISNRGQEIINLYLKGDAAELERRSYYNYNSSGYEEYPHMFSVASKLTSSKYLQRMLEFDEHYFQGVVYRLQIPVTGQHESLLAKAIKEQNQAIELNDNAACAQNEMGVLLEMKGDLINAEKYFVRATQIVPDWVIPWSNLTGLYVVQKNYQQGLNTAHISDSLKADFFNTVNNLGVLHENQKNYLLAEEYYRKAVTINSRPYYPFERMGYVYSNTTQYEVADSMFFEAEKRKKGYHFEGTTFLWISPMAPPLAGYEGRCDIDTAKIPSYDVMSWFYWAMDSWQIKNLYSARYGFRKVIAADPKDPLVFHYMGQMLYQDKNWKEAEVLLKFAIQYHLSDSQFFHHVDSLENSKKYSSEHECVKTYYSNKIYNEIEDHYLLASIYEKWGHYDEAESGLCKTVAIDGVTGKGTGGRNFYKEL
jgi:tetratricopeptide (TPR) repeat protein